ncbi:MAG TPA: bifunctional diaminohydroxyphosphoribosylaminopyrimidine deaminase/5-amino-6-(5-phosphoribosylamino)uracil reductase RibD [Dehalococcoidia bacterium]|nr:bifunctional diaminohydroxyphosphoribosylaminopyrimidine deaminase/5-amino-6-(5-phosphoribosylamino)uracil reductase RibD [Dehalococcoidia bacterium]
MKLALRLARRGLGQTSPNPMVGAIIVKDGRIIGQGYHHHYGGAHAEVNAIASAQESVNGATLYVTLEPCCHYGKTPPCVEAILQNKIARVVIGALDPNPRVNGRSVQILNQHGIETKVGVLEDACRELNQAHFKLMSTGLPLVSLKFAQTLDGRIATVSGDSRWISGEKFRRLAHKLRATHDAVMVGIDTVLRDNPELTVRLVKGRNPTRVILDSSLRIPLDAEVLKLETAPTIIATTPRADGKKLSRLRQMGVEVLVAREDKSGEVDLRHLLELLGERNISSVLVEGGAGVITSLLRQNLADKVVVAVAPKLMGKGIEAVGELNIREVSQAVKLSFSKIYRLGEDLVIEARLNPRS